MKKEVSTAVLQSELDELLMWFESDSIDIDEAVAKYAHGIALIDELRTRLAEAENTIRHMTKEQAE